MSDMFLDQEEISSMTGRVQRAAQVKALRFMGIEHRVRPDGSLAVLRAHVEKVFGAGKDRQPTRKEFEPNWEALAELRGKSRRPGRS